MGVVENTPTWFVMRDLKRPNALSPAWKTLPGMGFEVFTPLRTRIVMRKGVPVREALPVVNDLLFVSAERMALDKAVGQIPTLQYRWLRGAPYRTPMTVDSRRMAQFIRAVTNSDSPRYLSPSELSEIDLGSNVRIVDGPLKGVEGRLMSITRGLRRHRIFVEIPSCIAATVEVAPAFIEVLPKIENTII